MDFAKRLGRRVRQLRIDKKLDPVQVAWEAEPDFSRFHLSNIESGKKLPSLRVLRGIAERLGVQPFELLVFPGSGLLADVVEMVRRLPQKRLRELRAALEREHRR